MRGHDSEYDKLFELMFVKYGAILNADTMADIYDVTSRTVNRWDKVPVPEHRKIPFPKFAGRPKYWLLSDLISWWRAGIQLPDNLVDRISA